MAQVAVMGTGIMGGPMARNVLRAGHDVTVWNRTREKAESLRELGARVASTPAESSGHGDEDMSAVCYASAPTAAARA